ncbi:hypothetical protein SAMN04489727_1450 [Amycolatopsis tolypomycina]|uniref:Uncharacterized protein n=1 Tax=Amycolatopsis tolypomycina TaxID=208445 RepID=A0A1H4J2S5_9PSEU|nr:hypothetical protein [Amycolatopsis tolypomycina]SEB40521.1 hypothetical protein SAMN04489727_1450 [Amycolatopsis tolypomycina]
MGAAQGLAWRRYDGLRAALLRQARRRVARRRGLLWVALRSDRLGAAQGLAWRRHDGLRAALQRQTRLRTTRLRALLRVALRSGRLGTARRHGLDPRRRRTGVARRPATLRRRHPARRLVLAEGAVVVRAAVVAGPVVARAFAAGGPVVRDRAFAAGRPVVLDRAVAAGRAFSSWAATAGVALASDRAVLTR